MNAHDLHILNTARDLALGPSDHAEYERGLLDMTCTLLGLDPDPLAPHYTDVATLIGINLAANEPVPSKVPSKGPCKEPGTLAYGLLRADVTKPDPVPGTDDRPMSLGQYQRIVFGGEWFWDENGVYGLDDCDQRDTGPTECSGRMAHMMRPGQKDAVLCEAHYNVTL